MIRLAACFLLAALPAQAEPVCADRETVLYVLETEMQKRITGRGISGPYMVETLASERGAWSVVVTFADGRTCLLASGQDWREIKPEPNL